MADNPFPSLPERPTDFQLSPEFELLITSSWRAPKKLEQDQAGRISLLLSTGIDWDEFLFLIHRHGLPAQVYDSFCRFSCKPSTPAHVQEQLKNQSMQTHVQGLQHGAELIRLKNLFSSHDIEFIVLKGIMLSLRLFHDPGMRQSSDIDLMVAPENFLAADRLLRQEGYHCALLGTDLTENQEQYLTQNAHHFEYAHVVLGIHLELHCRSYLWTREESAAMWRDSRTEEWAGQSFKVLSDDALFLYLCEHGARHKWFRLKWLSDVTMLLSEERQMCWNSVIEKARQLGLTRVVAHTLLLIHWLYQIPMPQSLVVLVTREKHAVMLSIAALKALLLRCALEDGEAALSFLGIRRAWYMMRLKPSLSVLRSWKEVLISPLDFKPFPLPNCLFWLYVPLRPFLYLWRTYKTKE